jgi:hypothetical protein
MTPILALESEKTFKNLEKSAAVLGDYSARTAPFGASGVPMTLRDKPGAAEVWLINVELRRHLSKRFAGSLSARRSRQNRAVESRRATEFQELKKKLDRECASNTNQCRGELVKHDPCSKLYFLGFFTPACKREISISGVIQNAISATPASLAKN